MNVEAANGVYILELVLLPVQTMYRRTSGLELTCSEADPKCPYHTAQRSSC
jgi:hypothetical protein